MKRESPRQKAGTDWLTTDMSTAESTIDEAARMVRVIARPRWTDTRQSALDRAARSLGLTRSQARRIAYRERKSIPAHVMDRIRAAYGALEVRAESFAAHQQMLAEANQRERARGHEPDYEDDCGDMRLDREPAACGGEAVLEHSDTHPAPAGDPRTND